MPPVGKAEEALRRQKEAKQKKLLIVLVPVFLLLVFWQGPSMLKAFSGGSEPAEETAPAQSPATTADPASGAPPSTAGGAETTPPPSGPATLPETGSTPTAGPGQLVTFDRFVGKDPFRQQVEAEGESTDSGGSSGSSGADDSAGGDSGGGSADDGQGTSSGGNDAGTPPTTSDGDGGGSDDGQGGSPGGTAPTSATIEVNGTQEPVSINAPFPTFDPIFRLVSLTRRSAKIGLVSGEFSNGQATVTLVRGRPLTLVSEPDGLRYVITLVKIG